MSLFVSPRHWFRVEAVAYLLIGLPLLVAPEVFLSALGWQVVDPATSRLLGAALFAMGVQVFVGRNGDEATCRRLLDFDLLWAGAGCIATLVAIAQGAPSPTFWVLGLLIAVLGVAGHYRVRIKQFAAMEDPAMENQPESDEETRP